MTYEHTHIISYHNEPNIVAHINFPPTLIGLIRVEVVKLTFEAIAHTHGCEYVKKITIHVILWVHNRCKEKEIKINRKVILKVKTIASFISYMGRTNDVIAYVEDQVLDYLASTQTSWVLDVSAIKAQLNHMP